MEGWPDIQGQIGGTRAGVLKNVWFLLLFLETGPLYVVVAMLELDM